MVTLLKHGIKGISKNLDRSYRTGSGICFGVVRMGFRHNGRNDF